MAKHTALEAILRRLAKGEVKRIDIGREWYSLCQDLLKVWIHEASISMLEQIGLSPH